MAGLVIKPRSRIFHGHDWIYSSEVQKIFGEPKPGDVITLKDFRDRPLGSAIYNPDSQIVARRISRRKQDLDADFFVFSGHKLFAPTGSGVVYGKREWLDKMPPYQTGGSQIRTVSFEKTTYAPLPWRTTETFCFRR